MNKCSLYKIISLSISLSSCFKISVWFYSAANWLIDSNDGSRWFWSHLLLHVPPRSRKLHHRYAYICVTCKRFANHPWARLCIGWLQKVDVHCTCVYLLSCIIVCAIVGWWMCKQWCFSHALFVFANWSSWHYLQHLPSQSCVLLICGGDQYKCR